MNTCTKIALAVFTLTLAGCQPDEPSPDGGEADTADQEFTLPTPGSGVPEATLRAAVSDLAAHLELEASGVEVLDAKTVTWPNGALGCPEPGGMYTQALVDGYVIRLNAGGRVHYYHGRDGGDPFLCPPERREKSVRTSSTA